MAKIYFFWGYFTFFFLSHTPVYTLQMDHPVVWPERSEREQGLVVKLHKKRRGVEYFDVA